MSKHDSERGKRHRHGKKGARLLNQNWKSQDVFHMTSFISVVPLTVCSVVCSIVVALGTQTASANGGLFAISSELIGIGSGDCLGHRFSRAIFR
jgi:hypothetical protein